MFKSVNSQLSDILYLHSLQKMK